MKTLTRLSPILVLAAAILLPIAATADPSHYTYTVFEEKAAITGYTGPGGDITIPDTLDGYAVTTIRYRAFYNLTSLTSVTIPDGVTSIGDRAFEGCIDLTTVTIGNGVTSIGNSAFSRCTSLTSVTIPDSVTSIGAWVFQGCTSLTSVMIPDSVISISNSAFIGCTSLISITVDPVNPSYSSLDGALFDKNQTTLIKYPGGKSGTYTIPDGVTSIGNNAFSGCTYLTNVTIPDSVTSIGLSGLYSCTSLTNITVDPANPSYSSLDGVLFNKNQTLLIQYPSSKPGAYIIPDGVTSIGFNAFSDCTFLTSVTIPDGVTSISPYAFRNCTSLTSVTIPDGVTLIGSSAFQGCTSLTSVTIPDGVTHIGNSAFQGCTSLTSVTIPDGVTRIGHRAFESCTSLTSVYCCGTLPYSLADTFWNTPATLYYLPQHADRWPASYGGRPTALWLPAVTQFGMNVTSGAFDLSTFWAPGQSVTIEAATCLGASDWTPLMTTNIPSSGSLEFTDPDATDHATRFYRVVAP